MNLPTLKTRLEEATGPSRELDCEIAKALNEDWYADDENAVLFCTPPKYTKSIDAALELVSRKLPERAWRLGQFKNKEGQAEYWAAMDGVSVSYKPSLPIAILTALLSALIAEQENKETEYEA